ncbi:MAG: TVP38/TMEM64 family protein [Nitrospirae bacterium]|nr:TVP38/TMEM64 family protein [Nitrospirota bacterium]MBI3352720.1 TVP38/TMEM64 family protein [Nitrospirota bacterium]
MKNRTKSFLKLLSFIGALTVIGIFVNQTGLRGYLDPERLQTWVQGFGVLGPLIYVGVFMTAPSLFLPGLPITVAGGVIFGPIWGTVYASIGSTLGAGLAFLISRYFARQQISNLLGPKFQAVDKGVEEKGWVYVAITRLIPIFPYNLLNYAFGLTRIKFFEYLLTSWLCMLPATAAYVIFSSSLLEIVKGKISKELLFGLILLALVTIIPMVYRKRAQR